MAEIPLIISADDHVLEPPLLWVDRLSRRLRARGPRVERLPSRGGTSGIDEMGRQFDTPGSEGPLADYWLFEDSYWALTPQFAAAGFPKEQVNSTPTTYDEVRPGCYQTKERLADMDVNGVQASLCFPNYSRFAGQRFSEARDKELGLACIQAYNDWMVEEWAGESNGRLVPLCLVPLWDAELAAREVLRNAARGVRMVCFTEIPQYLGLPSLKSGAWDPFLEACNETQSVIAMHIGSGTQMLRTGPDMPIAASITLHFTNSAASMAEILAGGVLARFPKIRLLYAESQVGWIPYLLERLDDAWETIRYWNTQKTDEPPSTFYRGRIYSCMFKDHVGARLLDLVDEDQVLFECDYPHNDGTWPNTPQCAQDLLGKLPMETQRKILRGNALRLFNLPFSA